MIFSIQVSNPTYSTITNNDYDSIGDLLEDIFPLNTEQCIMFWNHVCIPLSYKYDISIILDDIIFIINEVSNNTNGYLEIDWPSNTFSAKWYISWDSVDLKINTKWYNIVGNIESILNNVNELAIKKIAFLAEWKKLVEKIIQITNDTNYLDKKNILTNLNKVNTLIHQYGIFYS